MMEWARHSPMHTPPSPVPFRPGTQATAHTAGWDGKGTLQIRTDLAPTASQEAQCNLTGGAVHNTRCANCQCMP